MIRQIFWLAVITLIPLLELRASIPFGLFRMGETVPWPVVVSVCVVANILLGWLIFLVLGPVFQLFRRWYWFDRNVWPFLERTRHRIQPYVEKYGELGVAVFIGIPLPGSGVYTGALGAYLLGVDRRKFIVATVIGVFIAAVAVTALSLLILHGVVGENSWAARLFLKKGI
ncbi:MAG TPA: hypothetical protein ENN17_03900 [bacterium]|nr:hypothetical protein [bacterium]